jgi:outer membrane lipoprotein
VILMKYRAFLLVGLLLLGACATSPEVVDTGPTPNDVARSGMTGGAVHWGGQIVKTKNLSDRTLVEVLAFPLTSNGRPNVNLAPQGRFIVEKFGFLEPQEYASNRLVEVRGTHNGFTDGKVGDAPYKYPVVIGQTLKLWDSESSTLSSQPRVSPRIGIGIGSGSGGTHVGGGVGIGIGF